MEDRCKEFVEKGGYFANGEKKLLPELTPDSFSSKYCQLVQPTNKL
jgi:hypothetical protein